MPPPGQTGRRRHNILESSVRLSVTELINAIFWKRMNWFYASWHKWSTGQGRKTDSFGSQKVKSQRYTRQTGTSRKLIYTRLKIQQREAFILLYTCIVTTYLPLSTDLLQNLVYVLTLLLPVVSRLPPSVRRPSVVRWPSCANISITLKLLLTIFNFMSL